MKTEFANRLCAAMAYRDVRTGELADKIGVNRNTITEWRAGRYMPNAASMKQLSSALQVEKD